jgi:hypothetical protein
MPPPMGTEALGSNDPNKIQWILIKLMFNIDIREILHREQQSWLDKQLYLI